MIQGGSRSRLAAKALESLRIVSQFLRKKLQGDVAAKLEVFGLVHHAHATAAASQERGSGR
jgi:hypothetical protein